MTPLQLAVPVLALHGMAQLGRVQAEQPVPPGCRLDPGTNRPGVLGSQRIPTQLMPAQYTWHMKAQSNLWHAHLQVCICHDL